MIARALQPDEEGMELDAECEVRRVHFYPGMLLTALLLMLLSFAGVKLVDPLTLPIRHVAVTGDFYHLSPDSLERRVSDTVTGGFFNVNVDVIQQQLMEEPWIRNVSVKRIWPDSITVNIHEQTAIANWHDEGLLNPEAGIFYPEPGTFPERLVRVSGPENSSGQILEYLLDIQKVLPEGMVLKGLIMNDRRSLSLTLNNGLVVRLGKQDVIGRVLRLVEYLPVEGGRLEEIEYIDMRYTNGFAIRWNQDISADPGEGHENNGKKI